MSFTCRIAEVCDIDDITSMVLCMALESENVELRRDVVRNGVSKLVDDQSFGFYVVAESNESGSIIGEVCVTYEWSDWNAGVYWWLQSVCVLPEHRKKGVFTNMLDFVKLLAREGKIHEKVSAIRLYHASSNGDAREVYMKQGFSDPGYRVMQYKL